MKTNWGDNLDVRYYLIKKLKQIKNKSVLDVGCGNGYLAQYVDDTNEYTGVDIDTRSVDEAKKRNPSKKFIVGEIQDIHEKYDIIVLANLIEMIEAKQTLIEASCNRLKPDGKILLTTPNGDNPYYKNRKITARELKKILSGYNYKLYYWNPLPIQTHHLLKYIKPFIMPIYEYLMDKINWSVSFYAEISLIKPKNLS